MLVIILLSCALIWTLLISHHINQRGFLVLMIWLFVAPLASNIMQTIASDPATQDQMITEMQPRTQGKKVALAESTIRLKEMLEPTRIIFGLFLLLYLMNNILKNNRLFNFDRTESFMLLFSIILVFNALLLSERPMFGLRVASDAFVIPFLGYALARRFVISEERFIKFAKVTGYMSLYVILIALVERMNNQEFIYRLSGPFPTANTLYAVLVIVFFITFAESNNKQWDLGGDTSSSSFLSKIVLYVTPIIIFLTLARGNWIGFLLSLIIFILMIRKTMKFSTKILATSLIMLFISLIILAAPLIASDDLLGKRIGNVANIYARVGAWLFIVNEGFNHPVLGIGLHNLRYLLATAELSGWNYGILTTVHNSFLAIITELGIVGLLTYAAIILSILMTGLRLYRRGETIQDRWRASAIISIFVAYLTPAMFANTLYIETPLHHVYAYAYAGSIAALYNRRLFMAKGLRKRSLRRGRQVSDPRSRVEVPPNIYAS